MKKNKRLEKEIKKLRKKKKNEDWFFRYGIWIITVLFVLGLTLRLIISIKNGVYQIPYARVVEVGSCYIK